MSTNTIDLSKVQFPDQMDLRTASIFLGLSEMRVRALARSEELPGSKDASGAWLFTKAELTTFKNTPRTRKGGGGGPRGDGKSWIIKVKFQDLEKVKEALAPFKIELKPRYDYAKQAAYRAKREAKLAAEKLAAKKG
jgi:hypothetical protein